MGCFSSSNDSQIPKDSIKIATINYCGIMNNPYQFYCDGQLRKQLQLISNTFLETTYLYQKQAKQDPKNFKWQCGKIDQKYRNRYSPFFILEAGYDKKNKKFMNKEQFYTKWKEEFALEKLKMNQKKDDLQSEDIKATTKYDFIMYHTLLRYVFPDKIKDKLQGLQKLEFSVYQKKLKQFYELSYLDEQRKLKKIQKYFKKVKADVFFVQQFSKQFLDRIVINKQIIEYHFQTDDANDTLILAKKDSFINSSKKSKEQLFKQMKQWNNNQHQQSYYYDLITYAEKPSVLVIDSYIFIGAHLTSKQQKNKEQIKKLKQNLHIFKQALHGKYQIVLAGDLNSYLEPYRDDFYFFPEKETQLTTIKMRTYSQAQFKKANSFIKQSKDKIISTLPFLQKIVSYIDGSKPNQKSLVPSDDHPFDHFMVTARIERKKCDTMLVL